MPTSITKNNEELRQTSDVSQDTNRKIFSDNFAQVTKERVRFGKVSYETDKILGLSLLERARNKRIWKIILFAPLLIPLTIAIVASSAGSDGTTAFIWGISIFSIGCLISLGIYNQFVTEKYILRLEFLEKYIEVDLPRSRNYAEQLLNAISTSIGAKVKSTD